MLPRHETALLKRAVGRCAAFPDPGGVGCYSRPWLEDGALVRVWHVFADFEDHTGEVEACCGRVGGGRDQEARGADEVVGGVEGEGADFDEEVVGARAGGGEGEGLEGLVRG